MRIGHNITTEEQRFLDAALRLARKHQGLTGTNPSVGCIIVKDLGNGPVIIGSGVTAKGGRPHAEPPALEEAGALAKDATAYVTLEPCAHHGKTPPCAQTLIDAGIKRVITATVDPDNRVNGKGHQMLLDADVDVVCVDGGENAARVLQGYLRARTSERPFVTLKLAMSADGLIGQKSAGNFPISRKAANWQTHLARARHDCILIGNGTALADDPMLTCRLPGMEDRSPVRIVLDVRGKLKPEHRLLATATEYPTYVVAPNTVSQEWLSSVKKSGAIHFACEIHNDRVALPELLEDLSARGFQSVMIEGGAVLSQSLLEEDLVDEIIVHVGLCLSEEEIPEDGVYASFTPSQLPDAFEICQELTFGNDKSLRLRKRN
ncbi:MAG: bifunctional diaminohydroxyphosphoribosylaminopyrimidine deaminase/5-amino-6-(5-phosphoribosylamino)uracil reductase RibD [Pseudomonadota bacterium]